MALTNQIENRDKMIMFGGLFGVFASISALVNRYGFNSEPNRIVSNFIFSLASHGVRTWRRNFLLPWMEFIFANLNEREFLQGFIFANPNTIFFSKENLNS